MVCAQGSMGAMSYGVRASERSRVTSVRVIVTGTPISRIMGARLR